MAAVRCAGPLRPAGRRVHQQYRDAESRAEAILDATLEGSGKRSLYRLQEPASRPRCKQPAGQRFTPAISSVFEGGFVLSFAVGSSSDLSLLLNFPEDRKAMYEMAPYPMIAEFRSLLEGWDSAAPNARWNGRNFFAYTAGSSDANPRVWVRCEGS